MIVKLDLDSAPADPWGKVSPSVDPTQRGTTVPGSYAEVILPSCYSQRKFA